MVVAWLKHIEGMIDMECARPLYNIPYNKDVLQYFSCPLLQVFSKTLFCSCPKSKQSNRLHAFLHNLNHENVILPKYEGFTI
jgi:hypothetical protein